MSLSSTYNKERCFCNHFQYNGCVLFETFTRNDLIPFSFYPCQRVLEKCTVKEIMEIVNHNFWVSFYNFKPIQVNSYCTFWLVQDFYFRNVVTPRTYVKKFEQMVFSRKSYKSKRLYCIYVEGWQYQLEKAVFEKRLQQLKPVNIVIETKKSICYKSKYAFKCNMYSAIFSWTWKIFVFLFCSLMFIYNYRC